VTRLFAGITKSYFWAGMLVSALSFAGGGSLLYCLARLDCNHQQAVRTVKYCCLWPGSFFFAAPMSESLFFLLSVACVYCGRKRRWGLAGLLGGLAAFTRSVGILLLVPLVYELIESILQDKPKGIATCCQFIKLLLIPLGFFAYCAVCKSVSGQWFKFLEYQRVHWYQSLGLFFSTAAYQIEYATKCLSELNYETLMGLWGMNLACTFASLLVMICAVRKLHPGYIAYYLLYFIVVIGATWLLSAPRYLIVMFPISMGLASLTQKEGCDGIATTVLVTVNVLYMFMFVNRWSVW
jgi:hypothetical protein